ATRERDVRVAEQDGLGAGDDRLQARPAQAVDRHGRRRLVEPAVERRHAGEVHVARLGVDDVAEGHMVHVRGTDAGPGCRLAHDHRAELRRRVVLEAASEGPYGGTDSADDDDFPAHGLLPGYAGAGTARVFGDEWGNRAPSMDMGRIGRRRGAAPPEYGLHRPQGPEVDHFLIDRVYAIGDDVES